MTSTASGLSLVRDELQSVEDALITTAQVDNALLAPMLAMVLPGSGKRLRPALALLTARLGQAAPEAVLHMAVGVELLHAASLVHDDVVDESALRRGDETLFTRIGNALAVLVGDYLFAQSASRCVATGNIRVIDLFAETLAAMCQGQIEEASRGNRPHLTLTRAQYYQTIWGKTASLFVLACQGAAILGGLPEEQIQAMRRYGDRLGLAFQVVDDILDFVGDEQVLGKEVGADLRQGTITLPVLCLRDSLRDGVYRAAFDRGDVPELVSLIKSSGAVERAYAEARALLDEAAAALEIVPSGEAREALRDLAEFVIERPS